MSILSNNLKKARLAAGLTQSKASTALGVTHSLLGAWEEGRSKPSLLHFPKIIEIYGIIDWRRFILDEHFDPNHQPTASPAISRTDPRYAQLLHELKKLVKDH
jgi:transcriptional regulator with XRE-family HTH domain